MSDKNTSERLRNFIYEHLDSVEQLEILLLLKQDKTRAWTAANLSQELRSNPHSIEQRLARLSQAGLVEENPQGEFRYHTENENLDNLIVELERAYRLQRHTILELIFSPLKKARVFAAAFHVGGSKNSTGGQDG